jgi:hypothetical protein
MRTAIMSNDFSAAHSTDAFWYAVDQHGNVGRFWTSEAGPLPNRGVTESRIRLFDRLRETNVPLELDVADLISDADGGMFSLRSGDPRDSWCDVANQVAYAMGRDVLVWIDREENLNDFFPAAWRFSAGEHVFAYLDKIRPKLLRALIQSSIVLRAWFVAPSDLMERLGIYCYEYSGEHDTTSPYLREKQPARPLNASELPEGLRQQIESLRLEKVDFARDHRVQPCDHTNCDAPNVPKRFWIDTSGELHGDRSS